MLLAVWLSHKHRTVGTDSIHLAHLRLNQQRQTHLRRSLLLGKPCSRKLSTLLIAAMVGWDKDMSRSVRSSLGISWNSLINLAFLEASLQKTDDLTHCKMLSLTTERLITRVLTDTWTLWAVLWSVRTRKGGVRTGHEARPVTEHKQPCIQG